jgi:hypothetical protein
MQDLVSGDVSKFLNLSRRPVNLDLLGMIVRPETKMNRPVAGGCISHTGCHVVVLCADELAHDPDPSADSVAALCALQSHIQPMTGMGAPVHPDLGLPANRRHHHVDPSIAVKITECAAAVLSLGRCVKPSFSGQGFPPPAGAKISENRVVGKPHDRKKRRYWSTPGVVLHTTLLSGDKSP